MSVDRPGSRAWGTRGPGALLELVRSAPAWTRAELARETGHSRTTIAERLDSLQAAGYVVSNPAATLTGGRPAETVSFNSGGGYILAADIGGSHTRLGVTRVDGSLLTTSEFDIDTADGPDAVLGFVVAELAALLAASGLPALPVVAIGVGVPGPVETATGRLSRPRSMPGWENVLVPSYFAREFPGIPVFVDKDANIMALGELQSGGEHYRNMIVLKAGMGIGCGVVVDGRVLHGSDGAAGDIAHIALGDGGACACGQTGCVEARASGRAIAARLGAAGREVRTSRDIVDLVRDQDTLAIDLVRQAGRDIAEVLVLTIAVVNPSVIIVGGNLAESPEPLLAGIREVVYSSSHPFSTRSLEIIPSSIGVAAGLSGAAHLALASILDPLAVDAAISRGERWG